MAKLFGEKLLPLLECNRSKTIYLQNWIHKIAFSLLQCSSGKSWTKLYRIWGSMVVLWRIILQ